jgi:hypothetical protein
MRPASSYEVTLLRSWAVAGDTPETDRGVTRMAPSGRRMDGSGRSRTSSATTYSVFTADGSIARRAEVVALEHLLGPPRRLDRMCLLMEVR